MGVPVINYVAIVAAAVASMAIGFVWYGPLFGQKWMKLSGIGMKQIEAAKAGMPARYLAAFVTSLVSAFVLAYFVDFADATTVLAGAVVGFWAWLGFVATVSAGSVLWENKPFGLYVLNNAHNVINFAVMGAILAAMP
jgi:hypothetical protein